MEPGFPVGLTGEAGVQDHELLAVAVVVAKAADRGWQVHQLRRFYFAHLIISIDLIIHPLRHLDEEIHIFFRHVLNMIEQDT